jgi:hypothetical protein
VTNDDLTDLAKRTLLAAIEEPPGSQERAVKFAAYDAIVVEAQRRVLNQISADLGLPPISPVTHRAPVSGQFPHIRVPWRAIAAELRYAVAHGMQPGEPVGSMDELAERHHVNRKTARKALVAVAAEGLIEARSGKRYCVPGTR